MYELLVFLKNGPNHIMSAQERGVMDHIGTREDFFVHLVYYSKYLPCGIFQYSLVVLYGGGYFELWKYMLATIIDNNSSELVDMFIDHVGTDTGLMLVCVGIQEHRHQWLQHLLTKLPVEKMTPCS